MYTTISGPNSSIKNNQSNKQWAPSESFSIYNEGSSNFENNQETKWHKNTIS